MSLDTFREKLHKNIDKTIDRIGVNRSAFWSGVAMSSFVLGFDPNVYHGDFHYVLPLAATAGFGMVLSDGEGLSDRLIAPMVALYAGNMVGQALLYAGWQLIQN